MAICVLFKTHLQFVWDVYNYRTWVKVCLQVQGDSIYMASLAVCFCSPAAVAVTPRFQMNYMFIGKIMVRLTAAEVIHCLGPLRFNFDTDAETMSL